MPTTGVVSNSKLDSGTADEPVFPLELFEEVINHLAVSLTQQSPSQFHKILSNVALVSHSFLHLVRTHLFRNLKLTGPITGLLVEEIKDANLAGLLETQPGLAVHVRHLGCRFIESFIGPYQQRSIEPFMRLPNLSSLSLEVGGELQWKDQDATTRVSSWGRVMSAYLDAGTLTTMELWGLRNIPIFNITSSLSLNSLTIAACSFDQAELISVSTTLPTNNIQRLAIRHCGSPDDPNDMTPFGILDTCTNLRHLELSNIHFDGSMNLRHSRFPLQHLEELHHLFTQAEPMWYSFCTRSHANGRNAFPMLKRLWLVMPHQPEPDGMLEEIFKHTPSLEFFELCYLGNLLPLDLPQTLRHVSPSLKDLSLSWKLDYDFDDISAKEVMLNNAIEGIIDLNLSTLQRLSLMIRLEVDTEDDLFLVLSFMAGKISKLDRMLEQGYNSSPSLRELNIDLIIKLLPPGGALPWASGLGDTVHSLERVLDGGWGRLKSENARFKFRGTLCVRSRGRAFIQIRTDQPQPTISCSSCPDDRENIENLKGDTEHPLSRCRVISKAKGFINFATRMSRFWRIDKHIKTHEISSTGIVASKQLDAVLPCP